MILTLEEAVEILAQSEEQDNEAYFKSQTRRLYDIANVLKALGIIEKVKYVQPKLQKNQKEKKNAFKWIGSSGFNVTPASKPKAPKATSSKLTKEPIDTHT
mmetsp:Transcript_63/g.48  ORF Transcript_63/g.48 Transcript_63/m.48 type:complete len:101 (+) Transcript_63:250-552(+)